MRKDIETADCLSDITGQDVMDSRDLAKLLERLEEAEQAATEGDEADRGEPLTEEEAELLKALRELREECEGYGWEHGIGFIRDTYFRDYAEELADDIGAIDKDAKWPLSHIDWDAAADELKQDYMTTDIGGVEFYYREA